MVVKSLVETHSQTKRDRPAQRIQKSFSNAFLAANKAADAVPRGCIQGASEA